MDTHEVSVRISHLPDVPTFNVKAVCMRTGITAATLRAWERRYGLPSPNRNTQGYRLYSERDVAILFWLLNQVSNGVNIGTAAKQFSDALVEGHDLEVKLPVHQVAERNLQTHPRSPAVIMQELTHWMLTLDAHHADELLHEAHAIYTLETVTISIMRAALLEVRHHVANGEATSTADSFAFNYLRQRLQMLIKQTLVINHSKTVIVIGFAREQNELDLMIFSLLLRRAGYGVTYLGAELDPPMLSREVVNFKTSALVFYTDFPEHAERLTSVKLPINALGEPLIATIAGTALEQMPELAATLPLINLGGDLRHAVHDLLDLLHQPSGSLVQVASKRKESLG